MNKKVVAAAVASALALPMAAHAVKFKTSGQINRAIQFQDDGVGSSVNSVDGDSSSTRFRFTGSEDMGNGITAGVNLEMQVESNSSASVVNKPDADVGAGAANLRQANVYFAGNFGKFTLGQGNSATDGMAFADLNNSAWLGGIENVVDFGGNIEFRGTAQSELDITVADVAPSYDGGRTDNVRYDTPAIGPLVGSISIGTDSAIDMMVQAAGPVGGAGQYDIRGGWANAQLLEEDDTTGEQIWSDDTWVISGSFKANQGTGITAAYGQQSYDLTRAVPTFGAGANPEDGTYYYIKLFHDWGNNSVAIDYKANEDTYPDALSSTTCTGGSATVRACGSTSLGIGFAHTIPKANVDFYTSYRLYTLEDTGPGVGAEDVSVFVVGSRIKFD